MILKNHDVKNTKNLLLGKGAAKEAEGSKILAVSSQGHHGKKKSRIFKRNG